MEIKLGTKVIGEIVNGKFFKRVKESKHLFRTLDAWGIDAELFHRHLLPDNLPIVIIDTQFATTYTTDAKTWYEQGVYQHHKEDGKKDHKAQIFLPRKSFTITY
jgi:hypothetical protein